MDRLQGKYVLITGASKGLGRQLALDYAREGAAGIAIVARGEADLKEVGDRISQITASNSVVLVVAADLSCSAVSN